MPSVSPKTLSMTANLHQPLTWGMGTFPPSAPLPAPQAGASDKSCLPGRKQGSLAPGTQHVQEEILWSQSPNGRCLISCSKDVPDIKISEVCSDLPEVVSSSISMLWTPRWLPYLLILKDRRSVHVPWHGQGRFAKRMMGEMCHFGTLC